MKSTQATLWTLLVVSHGTAVGAQIGDLRCESTREASCELQWDMTPTPRQEYVLERYDVEQRNWVAHENLPSTHVGSMEAKVLPGALFRIRGCQDYFRGENCTASVVTWVPHLADNVEALPDTVTILASGLELKVHKDHTLYDANMDYNVGLIMNVMNAIDADDVTPMAFPPVRIVDAKIVGGAIVDEDTRQEEMFKMMTDEMYLHNEMYSVWQRIVRSSRMTKSTQ